MNLPQIEFCYMIKWDKHHKSDLQPVICNHNISCFIKLVVTQFIKINQLMSTSHILSLAYMHLYKYVTAFIRLYVLFILFIYQVSTRPKVLFLCNPQYHLPWTINIHWISKDIGNGFFNGISLEYSVFEKSFNYEIYFKREKIPLHILLWVLQWHITNNSSQDGNLLSCSKFWAMHRDLTTFFCSQSVCARVSGHTSSIISIKKQPSKSAKQLLATLKKKQAN